MTHHADPKTIIIPTDVDDSNGYGVTEALAMCGIDRRTEGMLADMIEEQWLAAYRRLAADQLTAAGWTVILADGSIGSPEVDELERRHADDLAEIDELPCDMSVVAQAAKDDLWAWWQINAETLIAQHGARRCQICGEVEETCDCVMLGDDVVDALRTMADGGRTPTETEAEALRDLLVERDLLVRRDGGGWMLASIPEGVWLDLVEQAAR